MAGFPEAVINELTLECITKQNIEERVGAAYKIKILWSGLQAQMMEGSSLSVRSLQGS